MRPAKWFFNKHEEEPTTEVAIRRAPGEDLYIVLAGYSVEDQTATYAVTINPLVNWIWRAFACAAVTLPAGAATTSLVLILLLLPAAPVRAAQHVENPMAVTIVPRTQLEKDLQTEIICMCGTGGRTRIAEG